MDDDGISHEEISRKCCAFNLYRCLLDDIGLVAGLACWRDMSYGTISSYYPRNEKKNSY